jgi:hypothetical protein
MKLNKKTIYIIDKKAKKPWTAMRYDIMWVREREQYELVYRYGLFNRNKLCFTIEELKDMKDELTKFIEENK